MRILTALLMIFGLTIAGGLGYDVRQDPEITEGPDPIPQLDDRKPVGP